MPALTRWFIKSAMLYLVAALILSVAMQSPLTDHVPVLRTIWPTYLHLLVVGWLTQLIFGVAFWLFPRHASQPPRGSDGLGWAAFALLNFGLLPSSGVGTASEAGACRSTPRRFGGCPAAGRLGLRGQYVAQSPRALSMPRLSVWLIRTALCYLTIGFLAGAILLANQGWLLGTWVVRLRPIHVEFLLVGWMVQLALGVAFWILPRFRTGAERGREVYVSLSYGLLNAGVVTAAIGQAVGLPLMVPLGRSAEVLAAAAFSVHAWPRVKMFGTAD